MEYVINEEDVTIMEVEKDIYRQNQIQKFHLSEIKKVRHVEVFLKSMIYSKEDSIFIYYTAGKRFP